MAINTVRWNRLRYGLYAPVYNRAVTPLTHSRQRSIALLQVQPGAKVLLVGCGTGLDLDFLLPSVQVTVIDITPAMVTQTLQRAQTLGRSVDAYLMNAHHLTFADNSFDYVVLHLIVSVVPDPVACLQEASRVLKVGGTLSIFDKFLPDNTTPSLARRLIGGVVNLLFFDLNRQLGPLLANLPLRVQRHENALLGGTYTITQTVKIEYDG